MPLAFSAKTTSADRLSIAKYRKECLLVKKYSIKRSFKVDCYNNYHHYNSAAFKSKYSKSAARSKGTVRVASYNLLHPGSQRSIFKDLKLMANIINRWDLVVGLELLPIVGRDQKNNDKVVSWLGSSVSASKSAKVAALFRAPGYVNILKELRKLDKSWALLLSPRADSAKKGQVEELVGFFYRATRVKPIINEHCQEYKNKGDGFAYACLPNFRKSFMGRETTNVFSRRPFLASFESGNFDFSILGSHVIFGSPSNKTEMKKILKPSFGVDHYSDLGTGATSVTYARFAETAVTLEFMEKYKFYYDEQDIIYAADFNLTPSNKFWSKVFENFPGGRLYQKAATTVTLKKTDDGKPTNGLSSSYDHFILDINETDECAGSSGKARVSSLNNYKGTVGKYIEKNYIIRKKGSLTQSATGKKIRSKRLSEFKKYLKSIYTIKNDKIQWDDYQYDERVKAYDTRLFASQLSNRTFYKVQQELLSDHMPIAINCSTK